MSKRNSLSDLVSHDGLRDSLTGLMALPAFIEAAEREISSAQRAGKNLNLFLVSMVEVDVDGKRVLAISRDKELSTRNEDELFEMAARVLRLGRTLEKQFRKNDLICRYTFADLLILNSGSVEDITQKLQLILSPNEASFVCGQIFSSPKKLLPGEVSLPKVIAQLEKDMVALLSS